MALNILWPNSADSRHHDYNFWSPIELETKKAQCCTKDQLKATKMAAFSSSYNETIEKTC